METLKTILASNKVKALLWTGLNVIISLVIAIGIELNVGWLIVLVPTLNMITKFINQKYL